MSLKVERVSVREMIFIKKTNLKGLYLAKSATVKNLWYGLDTRGKKTYEFSGSFREVIEDLIPTTGKTRNVTEEEEFHGIVNRKTGEGWKMRRLTGAETPRAPYYHGFNTAILAQEKSRQSPFGQVPGATAQAQQREAHQDPKPREPGGPKHYDTKAEYMRDYRERVIYEATPLDGEIIRLVCAGAKNSQIAKLCNLAEGRVKNRIVGLREAGKLPDEDLPKWRASAFHRSERMRKIRAEAKERGKS